MIKKVVNYCVGGKVEVINLEMERFNHQKWFYSLLKPEIKCIARDLSGHVFGYSKIPNRSDESWSRQGKFGVDKWPLYYNGQSDDVNIYNDSFQLFPFTWDNEPIILQIILSQDKSNLDHLTWFYSQFNKDILYLARDINGDVYGYRDIPKLVNGIWTPTKNFGNALWPLFHKFSGDSNPISVDKSYILYPFKLEDGIYSIKEHQFINELKLTKQIEVPIKNEPEQLSLF